MPENLLKTPFLHLLNQWNTDHGYVTAVMKGENNVNLSMNFYSVDGISDCQFMTMIDMMIESTPVFHDILVEFENSLLGTVKQ